MTKGVWLLPRMRSPARPQRRSAMPGWPDVPQSAQEHPAWALHLEPAWEHRVRVLAWSWRGSTGRGCRPRSRRRSAGGGRHARSRGRSARSGRCAREPGRTGEQARGALKRPGPSWTVPRAFCSGGSMKPKRSRQIAAFLVAVANGFALLVAAALPIPAFAQPTDIDPQAQKLLKASTDFLASQEQFSLVTRNTLEIVLVSGQKIQFDHARGSRSNGRTSCEPSASATWWSRSSTTTASRSAAQPASEVLCKRRRAPHPGGNAGVRAGVARHRRPGGRLHRQECI